MDNKILNETTNTKAIAIEDYDGVSRIWAIEEAIRVSEAMNRNIKISLQGHNILITPTTTLDEVHKNLNNKLKEEVRPEMDNNIKAIAIEDYDGVSRIWAIEESIRVSEAMNRNIKISLQGHNILITPTTTLNEVYKSLDYKLKEAERFKNEIKQMELEENQKKRQKIAEGLVNIMDSIDFADLEQAIPYLRNVLEYNGSGDVYIDQTKLAEALEKSGYYKNMNVGKIDPEDKNGRGKWLVGQYMECRHPRILEHMDNWTDQFISKEQQQEEKTR